MLIRCPCFSVTKSRNGRTDNARLASSSTCRALLLPTQLVAWRIYGLLHAVCSVFVATFLGSHDATLTRDMVAQGLTFQHAHGHLPSAMDELGHDDIQMRRTQNPLQNYKPPVGLLVLFRAVSSFCDNSWGVSH